MECSLSLSQTKAKASNHHISQNLFHNFAILLLFTGVLKMISTSISWCWPCLSHLSSHLILTKAPCVTTFLSSFSKFHCPIDCIGVPALLTSYSTNSCMYLTLQPNSFLPISRFLIHLPVSMDFTLPRIISLHLPYWYSIHFLRL